MAEPYRTVVGLEVHVQLLTRTKLFCGCSTEFGLPPNSATCPVCLGLPGVLPVMNRKAFDLALKAALALDCTIAAYTKWDRKNYYYPDLPKNYQISQYDLPFSTGGRLEIDAGAGPKPIRLIRVHLEEDAGKSLHDETGRGGATKVDLNRTGTPLLEIVSEPDIASASEAKAYLEELRLLMRELGVSDCEMQEGSLRCDANVNVHVPQPDGSVCKMPLVEVKNLNSFRAVERAIRYEADRQYEEAKRLDYRFADRGKKTAGWDDARGLTRVQRGKEEASDYRYFPDPDLVPVAVDEAWLGQVRSGVGELPAAQRARLREQYGLPAYDAGVLTAQGRRAVAYFEEVAAHCKDVKDGAKRASNWVTNEVLATLNERKAGIESFPLSAAALAGLIRKATETGVKMELARKAYARMLEAGGDAEAAFVDLGIKVVADEGELLELVRKAIAANPQAVTDYRAGKVKAADRIKGFVMRETKGQAPPERLQQLLEQELARV